MSAALLHRPSDSARSPARVVRDLSAARRRREVDDLRQRAAWVEQARYAPRLEDQLDDQDRPDGPVRGPARITLLLALIR